MTTNMTLKEQIESFRIANPVKYPDEMYEKFLAYWEKEYKSIPKWMGEKQFKIAQRLAQWKKNETRYANKNKIQKFRELASRINPLK